MSDQWKSFIDAQFEVAQSTIRTSVSVLSMHWLVIAVIVILSLHTTETMGIEADVLVLGAGIAGLAAAEVLASHGLSVLLLEARNRIGGRVHSVPFQSLPTSSAKVDLGACWIHGNNQQCNPIAGLVAAHGIKTVATSTLENTLYYANGQEVDDDTDAEYEQLFEQFSFYVENLQLQQHAAQQQQNLNMSVADAQDAFVQEQQLGPPQRTALDYLVNTRIEQEYGADAGELSALYYDADTPCDGKDVLFPQGYSQVVAAVSNSVKDSILLQHQVQRISYSPSSVTVAAETPQGSKTFTAQYAVVTFPLGVLKKHSISMFDPPLPADKAAAIQKLGVGLLDKVIAVYDEAFWADTAWLNRLPAADDGGCWQEMFSMVRYLPELPVLVAFNAGGPAWSAEQDSDSQLTSQLTRVMAQMYPDAPAASQAPKEVIVTRWGSDPYALGSYACMAPGSSPADIAALAVPVGNSLFFAGEAASVLNQGTVHGAYSTGRAAANAILAQHKTNGMDSDNKSSGKGTVSGQVAAGADPVARSVKVNGAPCRHSIGRVVLAPLVAAAVLLGMAFCQ